MAGAHLSVGDSSLGHTLWSWGGISSPFPLTYSDELWSFAIASGSWTSHTPPLRPTPAVGGGMCAVGNTLYLFGGIDRRSSLQGTLYTYNTLTDTWALPGSLGPTPSPRAYHGIACANERIFIFAGSAGSSLLSDLSFLHTGTMTWSSVPATAPPTERKGHSLSHAGERLYVFGGSAAGGSKLNDAYSFDTTVLSWRSLQTSGDRPSAREGHAAAVLEEKLYICGGVDRYGQLNDVHALHLGSLRWTQPRVAGASPRPRWGMLSAIASQSIYIYGGVAQVAALQGRGVNVRRSLVCGVTCQEECGL